MPTREEVLVRLGLAEEGEQLTRDQVLARIGQLEAPTTGEARPVGPFAATRARIMEHYGPAMASFQRPIGRAAQGLTELVAGPEEQEAARQQQARLEQQAQRASPGVQMGLGAAAELGMLVTPARAGLGLAQAASRRIPRLVQGPSRQWITPLVGEATGMAAFRGAATPGTPEERAVAAGSELTAGLTGGAVGRGLEKTVRGIRTTPAADELLDQGAELTPGHAAEGRFWPFVESRMTYVPGLAGPTSRLETKALQTWNQSLLRRAVAQAEGADPSLVTSGGKTGAREAKAELGRAYDRLYGAFSDPGTLNNLRSRALDVQQRVMQGADASLAGDDITRVNKFIAKHASEMQKNASPAAVQRFTTKLKQARDAARTKLDHEEADLFEDALTRWRGHLDETVPGFDEQLRRIDRSYAMAEVFDKAASKAKARQEGFFTPAQLTSAASKKGELVDPEVEVANETIRDMVGRENIFGQLMVGGGGLGLLGLKDVGTAAATAGTTIATGRTMVTEPMRRAFLGRTGWQQAGQRALTNRRAQMLRSAMARAAAALPEEY